MELTFEVIVADCDAKIADLQRKIDGYKRLRSQAMENMALAGGAGTRFQGQRPTDAIEIVLGEVGHALPENELIALVHAGGILNGKKRADIVEAAINQSLKPHFGRLKKINDLIGLRKWDEERFQAKD